jgi:hypothetical protein
MNGGAYYQRRSAAPQTHHYSAHESPPRLASVFERMGVQQTRITASSSLGMVPFRGPTQLAGKISMQNH